MGFQITEYEETPNPNAVKCWLDRPVSDRPRSFLDAESAAGDVLATALFAVDGVRNLLFNGDWITVNKLPDADWKAVKSGVEAVLAESATSETAAPAPEPLAE